LVAAVSLALAFGLKDYVSSVIAGVMTIVENTYQPGDWIEIDGAYGEVTAIGARAVHIVTAEDTEVIIPHAKLWSAKVSNASGGRRSLCAWRIFTSTPTTTAPPSTALDRNRGGQPLPQTGLVGDGGRGGNALGHAL